MTMTYKACGTHAICEDGKERRVMEYGEWVPFAGFIKVPDTMFSIRARATIGGRTVYGWICTQSVKVTVHDGEKVHEEERDLLHFFANKKETN